MARRPAAVTESEIARAIKAARRAGAEILRILPSGEIEIDLRSATHTIESEPEDDVFET